MCFWDWRSGFCFQVCAFSVDHFIIIETFAYIHICFQKIQAKAQPGSIDSEAGIYAMCYDKTGLRLITAEADKSIKMYKEDDEAVWFC